MQRMSISVDGSGRFGGFLLSLGCNMTDQSIHQDWVADCQMKAPKGLPSLPCFFRSQVFSLDQSPYPSLMIH